MILKSIILLIIQIVLFSPLSCHSKELPGPLLYVANSGSSSVSVINMGTYEKVTTIPVGKWPTGVAVSPDRRRAYVMNSSPSRSSVSVINTRTQKVEYLIRNVVGPMHMAIDTMTGLAYITDTGDKIKKSVTIVDTNDNSVKAKKKFDSIEPFETVIIPDKRRAYVTLSGGYSVAAFSLIDYMTKAEIPVGRLPRGLAYDPEKAHLFVANHDDNTVSVIDTSIDKVISTIKVGAGPWYIAVHAGSGRAYVTCADDNSLAVIGTDDNVLKNSIRVGRSPRGIAVDSEGTKAYVANKADDSISVIDLTRNEIIRTVTLGKNAQPWGVALR